jgi:hypothetical protein
MMEAGSYTSIAGVIYGVSQITMGIELRRAGKTPELGQGGDHGLSRPRPPGRVELGRGDAPGQMTPPSARDDRHRAQAQFSAHGLPTEDTHDGQS